MTTIQDLMGLAYVRDYKPDGSRWPEYFGVELEVEGCNNHDPFGAWTTHIDNSLRDGIEFVLDQPLGGKALYDAISSFYARGLEYTSGPRTSTHIHMNMSSGTLDQVRSMVVIMYAIEDALFTHVGESRKWAGYAMALSEMPTERLRNILSGPSDFIVQQNICPARNPERYYGFNVASLRKHGTVEFRYYPGGPSKAEIESWLDFALSLKRLATSTSLTDMITRVDSPEGLVRLLSEHFNGEWMGNLLRHMTAQQMYDKFSEVVTFCVDADNIERRERLVFLTQPLVKFMNKNLLAEAGQAELAKVANVFNVLSVNDFAFYVQNAYRADEQAKAAKKKSKQPAAGRVDVVQIFEEMDQDLVQYWVPPAQAARLAEEPVPVRRADLNPMPVYDWANLNADGIAQVLHPRPARR